MEFQKPHETGEGRGYQDFGWGVGTIIFYVLRSQDMEN